MSPPENNPAPQGSIRAEAPEGSPTDINKSSSPRAFERSTLGFGRLVYIGIGLIVLVKSHSWMQEQWNE